MRVERQTFSYARHEHIQAATDLFLICLFNWHEYACLNIESLDLPNEFWPIQIEFQFATQPEHLNSVMKEMGRMQNKEQNKKRLCLHRAFVWILNLKTCCKSNAEVSLAILHIVPIKRVHWLTYCGLHAKTLLVLVLKTKAQENKGRYYAAMLWFMAI